MGLYRMPADDDLWLCPVCGRVERDIFDHAPWCAGTPEQPHAEVETRLLMGSEDLPVTDDRRLFQ